MQTSETAPKRAATPLPARSTASACASKSPAELAKELTRARWRSRTIGNRLAELERQAAALRPSLSRHQSLAAAAEAELAERDPELLAALCNVGRRS